MPRTVSSVAGPADEEPRPRARAPVVGRVLSTRKIGTGGTVSTTAGRPAAPGQTRTRMQLSLNDRAATGASYQSVSWSRGQSGWICSGSKRPLAR